MGKEKFRTTEIQVGSKNQENQVTISAETVYGRQTDALRTVITALVKHPDPLIPDLYLQRFSEIVGIREGLASHDKYGNGNKGSKPTIDELRQVRRIVADQVIFTGNATPYDVEQNSEVATIDAQIRETLQQRQEEEQDHIQRTRIGLQLKEQSFSEEEAKQTVDEQYKEETEVLRRFADQQSDPEAIKKYAEMVVEREAIIEERAQEERKRKAKKVNLHLPKETIELARDAYVDYLLDVHKNPDGTYTHVEADAPLQFLNHQLVLKPEVEGTTMVENARQIMGEGFLGPEAVENAFGIKVAPEDVPDVPFSEDELIRAKELRQRLILRVGTTPDGTPVTMQWMEDRLQKKLKKEKKGKLFYDTSWYKNQAFFTKETSRAGWTLISEHTIPASKNKNYLQQTQVLANHLSMIVFPNRMLPEKYKEAIAEYEQQKDAITGLMRQNWAKAAEKLSQLKLNQLTRRKPVEAMYDSVMILQNNDERLLGNDYDWTISRSSFGDLVRVGRFGADGARVSDWRPDDSAPDIGVVLSRT